MSNDVLILGEPEIREALDMPSCIEAVEAAFVAASAGRAELPEVIHLDVPDAGGEVHVKAGFVHGSRHWAVKVSSGFYGPDPPAYDGLVVVFDAADGSPLAFLLDNGHITNVRTGAAGGVAARHLAPERVEVVAVLGTGLQAGFQLQALSIVRPGVGSVRIWGRSGVRAAARADELRAVGVAGSVQPVADVRDAVDGADVVITCTASREPILRGEWLRPGAHVTAVGADAADKQELDPEVLSRADVVAVDSRAQCARLGELHHAVDRGFDPGRAIELGEVAAGTARGRTSADQLTVCDLTGLGLQDVTAASLVLTRLAEAGKRTRV